MVSPPNPPAPQFQSTPTVWPLQGTSKGAKPTTEASTPPSKPKSRNRNRKKAAKVQSSEGAPPTLAPPVPSTSNTPAVKQSTDRTSFPWRGSGRGRGRGGANSTRGGASSSAGGGGGVKQNGGARGFSTATTPSTESGGRKGDEGGTRVLKTALFQSTRTGVNTRRGVQTDANAASTPAPTSTSTSAPARRGGAGYRGGGRGRGRGKARGVPGGDRGTALLEKVKETAGEEDLEAQIHALYDIQRPSPESIAAREHLISELTGYLNRERFHWGHPHSATAMPLSIEPFGSIRFGLGTSTSDLDLCLLDPYRPNGFEDKWYSSRKEHMQDLPDIYQMRKIGNSLYRAGLDNIHPIPDAAVPICKFEVEIDGQMIQADLNTNERLGVYNSRLLNSYCNLHPLVRPLSVFIKFWASQRGLNNPSGDQDGIVTFSSYTLILLVISYLQQISLLPNLQDEELIASTQTERSRFFSTPKAYSRRGKLRHLIRSVGWDVTFVEYDQEPEGYETDEAILVELARGFFHFWGEEFNPKENVVSIANGAPFPRERLFGQAPTPDPKATLDGKENGEDGISKAERKRQEMEDLALEAFADERAQQEGGGGGVITGGGAAQTDDPHAELDAIAQAQSELDEEREKATRNRSRANSRSSSPIPYGDFAEPEKWTEHMLVVQDPFILTRNCAGNVRPDWVEELRIQMRRARDLIDEKAPISKICLHHYSDPDFLPIAFAKQRAKAAEQKKKQQDAMEAARLRRQAEERAAQKQEEESENQEETIDGVVEVKTNEGGAVTEDLPAGSGTSASEEVVVVEANESQLKEE
ncbi:uncharacterized protein JCM6883_005975 [Sporobolomyces salmoneus]|uniref:uncharacterized protein n=1 Tax=Sporobolomyces salmoneus TaxID=183962 RepID=UPI0031794445